MINNLSSYIKMKFFRKIFPIHYLDHLELTNKVAKRIEECEKMGLYRIQIYFNQEMSKWHNLENMAISQSRQAIHTESLVQYVSLYSGSEIELKLGLNQANEQFLEIIFNPVVNFTGAAFTDFNCTKRLS